MPTGMRVKGEPAACGPEVSEDPLEAPEHPPTPDMASLYRAEGPRLLRFFRRRIANAEDARDLMQESFSRLLGAGTGRDVGQPEAYLTRIGQNLLRDRAKFSARRSEALHVPADEAVLTGADQFRLLETRDLLDRLNLAMLELPQETREVFMAHRVEGLTYVEIAERTGLSVKQVEKRIARAMLDLSDLLGPR